MFYKGLLLIILSSAFVLSSYADDFFNKKVEELIYEKINDQRITVDLQYESKDKLEKIKDKSNNIESVLLVGFDPIGANFKVKVNYNTGFSEELFGRYISSIEVPVISRLVKAGDIITPNDLILVKARMTRVGRDYVINEHELIGMQAKKNLSNGSLVKKSELRSPSVIKTNDPVNIVYYSNKIKLKTSGIALGAGALGDMVKVKNENTGVVLLGQIVNKNTVQVGTSNE